MNIKTNKLEKQINIEENMCISYIKRDTRYVFKIFVSHQPLISYKIEIIQLSSKNCYAFLKFDLLT